MSAEQRAQLDPSVRNPRFVRRLLLSILLGSLSLCIMSALQKITIGSNALMIKGYILPFLFGGTSGGIIWTLHCRSRFQLIERMRIERDSQASLKMAHDELTRLATAVEQAGESLVITDLSGNIQYVNPAFTRATGYTAQEARGQNPRILQSGEHSPQFYEEMWATLSAGETWRGNLINRSKDGTRFHEFATITPLRRGDGKSYGYVAVKRDITKQIELERQLFQSQKMEIMGQISGQIAHDFRNVLTVIQGQVDLLLHDPLTPEKIRLDLEDVLDAAERATALTRNLMLFSRGQDEPETEVVDIVEHLKNSQSLFSAALGKMIRFDLVFNVSAANLKIDTTRFDQVIMNLLVNARDALPRGGKVQVELAHASEEELNSLPSSTVHPTRMIHLSVADDGPGMQPEVADRAFQPFFTTKERGRGTGLGLATVKAIIKQHGGHISLESLPGIGTTFHIFLPVISTKNPA